MFSLQWLQVNLELTIDIAEFGSLVRLSWCSEVINKTSTQGEEGAGGEREFLRRHRPAAQSLNHELKVQATL